MATYTSQIHWQRNNTAFDTKSFDRTHEIALPGGVTFKASSAPEYAGLAEYPNPEELFTASLSSCLMLTFLYLAAMKGLVVDDYQAEAIGTLAKNAEGKLAITEIVLKPKVKFQEGKAPDADTLNAMFKKAHDNCFISSSVKSTVKIEPS